MRLLDDKDIAAVAASTSQLLKDAIGETARVLVTPALAAVQTAIDGAVNRIRTEIVPAAAEELRKGLTEIPGLTVEAADQIMDSVFSRLWRTRITIDIGDRKP
jgi:hypothetical protein